ncbi:yju2 [Symbiodinium microadriaticum]|nr:yju2 [Symbiodinium microadriaticum]
MNSLGKRAHWKGAVSLIGEMKARRLPMSLVASSAAVAAAERGGSWQVAVGLFWECVAAGLTPDVVLWLRRMKGCAGTECKRRVVTMADGTMSSKFMKSAFVGWTFTAGVYYPPDFDASKLMPVKALKPKGPQTMNIRMMFPFTMVCDSCKEYNYTGTKFTAKVEQIKRESYLGLKVYRFYGRCRHCWSEFTFKTDPKNSDYTMESGGKRTYEAWKDADAMESQLKQEREKEAAQDQMKALEQKAVDVQSEMQRLEDLDAIRTMNKRMGNRDQSIQGALDYLFKQEEARSADEEKLSKAEMEELKGFKEEKERFKEEKEQEARGKLDEEVVDLSETPAEPSASSAASKAPKAPQVGSAILAAVAERASAQAAKAKPKFAVKVKRKANDDAPGNGSELPDSKRPCIEGDDAPGPPAPATSSTETSAAAGGLLGAYADSDSHLDCSATCEHKIGACEKGEHWPMALVPGTDGDFGAQGRWDLALHLLQSHSESRLEAGLISRNRVISACAAARCWSMALELLEFMQGAGMQVDVYSFGSAISACATGSMWREALSALGDMQIAEIFPSIVAWNSAVSACARAGQWQRAFRLLGDLEGMTLEADVVTYSSVMKACDMSGEWQLALALLGSLRRQDVRANLVAFNTAISACVFDRWALAVHMLQEAIAQAMCPDPFSLASALDACSAAEDWPLALNCLREGRIAATTPCWNAMIKAAAETGGWTMAVHLLQRLPADHLQPNIMTSGSTLKAAERASEWDVALLLATSIPQRLLRGNVIIYNSLLSALSQASKWQAALHLLDSMAAQCQPDSVSYNTTITACSRATQSQHAMELLSSMEHQSLQRSAISFNSAAGAFADGRWTSSLELLASMSTAAVAPNAGSCSAAMNACEKGGEWRWPLKALATARPGLANAVVYNAAMSACAQAIQWIRACDLMRQMTAATVAPTIVTFNSLVNALASGGQPELALQLLRGMGEVALLPNAVTLPRGWNFGSYVFRMQWIRVRDFYGSTHIYVETEIRMRICIHIYIYMSNKYIYIYIYICVCVCVWVCVYVKFLFMYILDV